MLLKIKYLGYSCFLVETYDGVRVIVDPFNDTVGYKFPKDLKADIALISHAHQAHSNLEAVSGTPAVFQGPGYRECGWVKIKGISAFHDDLNGTKYGPNTIFCWDMRAIKLCHLGDLGHLPDTEILKQIGPVDILFVPIGGKNTLDPEKVEKLLNTITYKYLIPMKYKTRYNPEQYISLGEFIKDRNNIIIPEPKNEFVINRQNLAVKDKQLIAMEYIEQTE